ncbi:hypothetical protein [Marinobacter sediminicola]|uniref:hypothetical protein n=1 Tax=Marinobacter sediminicola TaxID=3072994 RepID=UPI0028112F55|nr:hypothetical protein [Marinobacter sp. F26243]
MSNKKEASIFTATVYRGSTISALPESPRERSRFGDELQPLGTYADADPYYRIIEDVDALQTNEQTDPEFKSKDWWWDHQKIRFLNEKLGFKFLLLLLPFTWVFTLIIGGGAAIVWGWVQLAETYELPALLLVLLLCVLGPGWLFFSLWIIPPTTNWLMSTGIGFVMRPFEKGINKKLDQVFEDGCSEFNRQTGQIRFALGRKRFFEAPFVEFDAYVERVVQQGGIFYRLMFVHRYTQKTFNKLWFSGIEARKTEVYALWDMLQRYMDVSQPLPDVPRLEPFRHLDPVTRKYDEDIGRKPRYWRDLNLEEWKTGEGQEVLRRQREYPWDSRVCKLTPQLGRISMEEYRQNRPAGSWPI